MPRRKPKTAAEFVEELERDSEYRQRRARGEAVACERSAAFATDEASIVRDLAAAGIRVGSLYDFVRVGSLFDTAGAVVTPTPAAPILLRHLHTKHGRAVREGILRALAYAHLRSEALSDLKALYPVTADPAERWLVANAISAMATFKQVADVQGIDEHRALFKHTPAKRRGLR